MALNKNLMVTDTGSNRRSSTGIPLAGTMTASGSYQSTKTAAGGKAAGGEAAMAAGTTNRYAPDGTEIPVSTVPVSGGTAAAGSSGSSIDLTKHLPKTITGETPAFLANAGAGGTDDGGFPGGGNVPGGGGGGGGGGGYSSGGGGGGNYQAATLRSAASQADYINAMYKANEERQRAALEAQYDANVAALDRQAATIAPEFQQAANAAAAQSAVAQAAFNERAAAAGINTGAGSQAALAQNNALLSGISAIRQAESEALADVEAQRVSLAQQYQKAIADAVANNEAAKAQALYDEAVRVDESLVATAANQATENYRAWQARYG